MPLPLVSSSGPSSSQPASVISTPSPVSFPYRFGLSSLLKGFFAVGAPAASDVPMLSANSSKSSAIVDSAARPTSTCCCSVPVVVSCLNMSLACCAALRRPNACVSDGRAQACARGALTEIPLHQQQVPGGLPTDATAACESWLCVPYSCITVQYKMKL